MRRLKRYEIARRAGHDETRGSIAGLPDKYFKLTDAGLKAWHSERGEWPQATQEYVRKLEDIRDRQTLQMTLKDEMIADLKQALKGAGP